MSSSNPAKLQQNFHYSTASSGPCQCNENSSDYYIVRLHKPWHHFDSNHWFHIAEYYLSRHRLIDSRVPDNSSLVIISQDPMGEFTTGITEITVFMLMMSFTRGSPKEVEIYDYSKLTDSPGKGMKSFMYNGPVYHYRRDNPLPSRYFLAPAPAHRGKATRGQCVCGHYVDDVGAAPVDRGFWFSGATDVKLLREKIDRLCPKGDRKALRLAYAHILRPFTWTPSGQPYAVDSAFVPGRPAPPLAGPAAPQQDLGGRGGTTERNNSSGSEGAVTRSNASGTLSNLRVASRGKAGRIRGGISRAHNGGVAGRSMQPAPAYRSLKASTQQGIVVPPAGQTFKMLIYQRDEDRKFLNLDGVMRQIRSTLLDRWAIEVINHDEKLDPCLLSAVLKDADIFLTTHGFQSMGILFMKKGAVIIEVFPFKYWKVGYRPLADEFGVHHRWVQNKAPVSQSRAILYLFPQDMCMWSLWCRDFSRADDVIMTPHMMDSVIGTALDVQRGALGAHNAPAVFGVKW